MESTTNSLMGNGSCLGNGCCQANILVGYSFYNIQINRLPGAPPYPLSLYIVDHGFHYSNDMIQDPELGPKALPATLDWVISNSKMSNEYIGPGMSQ